MNNYLILDANNIIQSIISCNSEEEAKHYGAIIEPYYSSAVEGEEYDSSKFTEEDQLVIKSSIRSQCSSAIISGFDLNDEHFSLEETDQINLATALSAIQSGATQFPYHSDGNICRFYTADEITAISEAATQHKLYHTTLCNHLLRQIEACNTVAELKAIEYSVDSLSDELKESFNTIISSL